MNSKTQFDSKSGYMVTPVRTSDAVTLLSEYVRLTREQYVLEEKVSNLREMLESAITSGLSHMVQAQKDGPPK